MKKEKRFPLQKIKSLAKKYHLSLVILFGSRAQGNVHKESDLDIAFYAFGKVNEQKLYEEFMQLFKRADIDVVNLSTTHNHALRFEILHKGIALYEEEKGLKSKMEWQSYFDFMDFQKYYALRSELLEQKLAERVVY